jgi:hypothetical protein
MEVLSKGDEIIFTVLEINDRYLCRALAATISISKVSLLHGLQWVSCPPYSILLDYCLLDTKFCTVWEWELEERNLPIYATWKFCCDDFIKRLGQ